MVRFVIASLLLQVAVQSPSFKFAKEQRVYVVAVEANSRELASARASLELERMAKDEFRKANFFRVASTLRDSDFVFFVLLDAESANYDEVALAVSPADYEREGGNLDRLRNCAVWQADNHFFRRNSAKRGTNTCLTWISNALASSAVTEFQSSVSLSSRKRRSACGNLRVVGIRVFPDEPPRPGERNRWPIIKSGQVVSWLSLGEVEKALGSPLPELQEFGRVYGLDLAALKKHIQEISPIRNHATHETSKSSVEARKLRERWLGVTTRDGGIFAALRPTNG